MTVEAIAPHMPSLLVILSVYVIGAASPGPSTLMIATVAARQGRGPAVALASGVTLASLVWACVAATGFAAILSASAIAFTVMKWVGGLFLLYLAARALRSAATLQQDLAPLEVRFVSRRSYFARGVLMHISNPKAPLVWLATLSVGLGPSASPAFLLLAIAACSIAALFIFLGYALLFSGDAARRAYHSSRRVIDGIVGILFGAVAIRILTLKSA